MPGKQATPVKYNRIEFPDEMLHLLVPLVPIVATAGPLTSMVHELYRGTLPPQVRDIYDKFIQEIGAVGDHAVETSFNVAQRYIDSLYGRNP